MRDCFCPANASVSARLAEVGMAKPNTERAVVPPTKLIRPLSPFERRMLMLSLRHQVPPLGTPAAAHLQRLMDMDVAFQLKLKELQKRLPLLLNGRLKNGSGLQLSKLLR